MTLCDQADFGGATSSASTKLIHGGLRYLETYQFRLVRESLIEREILLRAAPHIVLPLRFRLPHHPGLRPAWMIRAGLFLYDHLGRRVSLPSSRGIRFDHEGPLLPQFTRGFEYADCRVDDARLVILNVLQASSRGATVLPRYQCVSAETATNESGETEWHATLQGPVGNTIAVHARCVVNVGGPWVSELGARLTPDRPQPTIRLVKGSHIIVPRVHDGEEAYLLQNSDGRVVFVIPYQQQYSLIGTTEQEYSGDPAHASISDDEIKYLLAVTAEYFRQAPQKARICGHFAGVRPLIDETAGDDKSATRLSRDYRIDVSQEPAPMVTVYGGKLTTYRRLAESVVENLRSVFPDIGSSWTADATLPGGDFSSLADLDSQLRSDYPWAPVQLLTQWARRYGTRVHQLLERCESVQDLGALLGPDLYEREARYLIEHEWAAEADDILWRRTKLGLAFGSEDVERLTQWMAAYQSAPGNLHAE